MKANVYAIATMDTKGEELFFVASCLRDSGVNVIMVDVGTLGPPTFRPDISMQGLIGESNRASSDDRGLAIAEMSQALRDFLISEHMAGKVSGVIGLGGSGGTSLITAAMRCLPIGMPKLMVSTMASGNTAPYVDCSDITMMYSVVDIAGLNGVLVKILGNAANAMAGMVSHATGPVDLKPTLGMTMFGVTTPCVTAVRQAMERKGYECLVFHATGTGGRAMEQLVESGLIQGVLDITTTEVADEVVGGVLACGPHRFDKLLASRVPLVLSVGALDMVNFGGLETVPEKFRNRNLHVHNAQVTLMRTNVEENRRFAEWIAERLNRSVSPLVVMIPEKGISGLDALGQPFYDPVADQALFDELELRIHQNSGRRIVRLPYHVNDPEFAEALVTEFQKLCLVEIPQENGRSR